MDLVATAETDQEALGLEEIDASAGKNPDLTGDFSAGRTRIFLFNEEFLAFLASLSSRRY
ncbi:hypothetical protein [Candidatus Spongiisocius sp.]|uniref:hypothetical protein n=1 Tax=Candidatus Spongiisocius sp. TaxID=3101273 RepID=UPI003B5C53AE